MKFSQRLKVFGIVGSLLMPAAAMAANPGLGQSWPDAPDMSIRAGYHVYVFERSGIRYVQVNDAGGRVRGAAGVVGDQIFGLPIGSDAPLLTTPSDSTTRSGKAPQSGELIYQDDTIQVLAEPQAANALRIMVQSNCQSDPAECVAHRP